jgi:hypothetical protein
METLLIVLVCCVTTIYLRESYLHWNLRNQNRAEVLLRRRENLDNTKELRRWQTALETRETNLAEALIRLKEENPDADLHI